MFAKALGPDIKHKRTRPYRPQTNGKVGGALEESVDGRAVSAKTSPYQASGVVVDDDGQVLVATLLEDLVDPDPCQTCHRIGPGSGVGMPVR